MYAEEECLHGVDSGYVSMMPGEGGGGEGGCFAYPYSQSKSLSSLPPPYPLPMDQITKKKPNLKCRLYCLIE
jgi:hypothetical protein